MGSQNPTSLETGSTAQAHAMTVVPAGEFSLDTSRYPWLPEPGLEVPIVSVELLNGAKFQYGSLIGFSNAARKIADNVPETDSASAQSHLFTALPDILRGDRHPGIGKVENARPQDKVLLSASRNITRAVRLIFAVEQGDDPSRLPTVLRAGISLPNDHNKLMRSLGVSMIGKGGPKKMRRA